MSPNKNNIETTGYIKKEQGLTTVENNIIPNTFVLESQHPYPGYHGTNLPERLYPHSLFLILNKEYTFEEICRISKRIKKKYKYDFNASFGHIYFKTSTYPCIRIKYLKSFTFIPELQELFRDQGIKFAKQKTIHSRGLIVIQKSFYVEESEVGIYNDLEEDSKHYIELPIDLQWEVFKEFTASIKNNISNSNFDAALGVFYRKKGIVEVVRLYLCEENKENIKSIQKMYLDLIQKRFN